MCSIPFSDWDNFVLSSIQLWKNYYLNWIGEGNQILIVYYDDLKSPEKLKASLKNIITFMNFTIDEERLDCVLKHPEGVFHRKESCYDRNTKPKNIQTDFIYSNQQISLINSAIKQVNKAMRNRGLKSSHLPSYENTNVKLKYCSCK